MSNINTEQSLFAFKPSSETNSDENFQLLVNKAKESFPYLTNQWKDGIWDITAQEKKSIQSRQKRQRLVFGLTSAREGKQHEAIVFERDFDDLIKSFLSVRYIERGIGMGPQQTLLIAFRYLYQVIKEDNLERASIQNKHFLKAAENLKQREAASTSYRIGNSLELLANLFDRFSLTVTKINYLSSFKRTNEYDPLSEKTIERGNKLQLSEDAIEAILTLNHYVDTDNERLIVELIKLLFFTGFRISELLALENECLILKEENGEKFVGIRYFPLKQGNKKVRIRWFGELSGKLVKQCISDIQRITKDARRTAIWLIHNPGKSYFRVVMGNKPNFRLNDFKEILSLKYASSVYKYLNDYGVNTPITLEKLDDAFGLKENKFYIFEDHASGYKVRLDKALFIIFQDTFSLNREAKRFLPILLTEGILMLVLAGKKDVKHPRKSIFEKYNLFDKDGGKILVTSHMFRRYLNTIYNEGGVPLTILTKVFGRSNPKDSLSYIYTTPKQRTGEARKLFKEGSIIGPKVDIANKLPIKKREEFIDTVVESVHYLGHGFCSHDWSTLPCAKHLQCLDNCIDFLMKKDDPKTEQYLIDQKIWAEKSLISALVEVEEGTYGASSQADHYRRVVETAEKYLKRLDIK